MNIIKISQKQRTKDLVSCLTKLWRSSVVATHDFLDLTDINRIAKSVPDYLRDIPTLYVVKNEQDHLVAFMGVDGKSLEMLFVHANELGKGFGSTLLRYGIIQDNITEVNVNEQNPRALSFYEHMGFEVYKRTETDTQGEPYPILYMRRH